MARTTRSALCTGCFLGLLLWAGGALSLGNAAWGNLEFLSSEERVWLQEKGASLRIAPDPHFPPLEFFDDQGTWRGIAPSYVALLEKILGLRFTVVRLESFQAVLDHARGRSIDIATTVVKTPERTSYLRFTSPYIRIPNVIVVRQEREEALTIPDLQRLSRVVYQRGYAIGDVLKDHGVTHARPITDPTGALRDLAMGRLDAMVGNLATISYYARQLNLSNLRVAGDCDFDDTLSFASRSDEPLLSSILEKALGTISPQEREAIRDQWIKLDPPRFYQQKEFWRIVLGSAGFFVLVVGLLAGWNRTLRRQVARRTAELQQKNDEMTRFLYTVSHDLKSPLVTIKTFLGYLRRDLQRQNTEALEQDMGFIADAAQRMTLLLDELLELSRIGRHATPPREVLLQDVVDTALALVAGPLAERHVTVVTPPDPVILFGDVKRLVDLYQNLIENAVKFMGDQPEPLIEIGWRHDADTIQLFVRDNGEGIDPVFRPKLFDIFEKLRSDTEGVGMGLAIVKRIVEVHGGTITADSEGPGRGTTFSFVLAGTRLGSLLPDPPGTTPKDSAP